MKIQIGGLCTHEHLWFYEDDDTSCASKSFPVFVELEDADYPLLPAWVQRLCAEERPELAQGGYRYFLGPAGEDEHEVTEDEYRAALGCPYEPLPVCFGCGDLWGHREWVAAQ